MEKNSKIIKKLKSDSFILLKNSIDKKLLKKLLFEVGKVRSKIKNLRDIHYINNNNKKKLSSLHNIHLYSKFYKKFIYESKLNEIVKEIFGTSSKKIFNSSFFVKPAKCGIETKMHQDNAFFNLKRGEALTCWIPLDKTSYKNSCLYYYKGSSKLGNLSHVPEGNVGASMTIANNKKMTNKLKKFKKTLVAAQPGDCIIHDSLVIHGSKKNLSSYERRALNFSIKSKKDTRNKKMFLAYKNKLENYLKLKKNVLQK
jgi:ectoine hydroxylase-related dioxygenase (phytanoyl-CoA dioxygenase family)